LSYVGMLITYFDSNISTCGALLPRVSERP